MCAREKVYKGTWTLCKVEGGKVEGCGRREKRSQSSTDLEPTDPGWAWRNARPIHLWRNHSSVPFMPLSVTFFVVTAAAETLSLLLPPVAETDNKRNVGKLVGQATSTVWVV